MENFSELIKNRRSMRKFTDEELTQDEVVTLMKAALMSPSSKRSNSWQFVVIDDKEMLKELSHCKEQASSFIADAALAIVVMADPLASVSRQPECLPTSLCMEFLIYLCSFRYFLSLRSAIRGWNANLSMKNISNGRKSISISSEENNNGSCQSK